MKIDLHDSARIPFYQRISYLFLPALFVVTSVLLEVIMFALMRVAFPKAYIFSLAILLIVAAVVALFRRKWIQIVICSLLLGWQLMTTISNVIANDTCMEIFSLETLKTLGMAFGNAGAIELGYGFLVPIIALIVIYVVVAILIMWFCRTPKIKYTKRWQIILCGILAFVSFFSYTVAYSGLPNYQLGTAAYVENLSNQKFLYDTFSNRVSSLRTFGSYSYYLDNFLKLIGVKVNINQVMDSQVNDEFQANDFALDTEEVLGEGYNLIMVLMETFEREAVNPVTMPNLYQFMQQSCYEVDGYYSIERTCFTDHIGQTGMHVAGKELWNNYGNVEIPHSLANIFKRSGYTTNAFHDFDGSSYQRKKIFTEKLGFDSFTDFNDYETKRQTAHCGLNSDYDLFTQNLEAIAPADQNFYSYIISVSTHSLNASWFNLRDYYPDVFAEMEKPENWEKLTQMYPILATGTPREVLTAENYLAGTRVFDDGFGALLDRLKNTVDENDPYGRKLIETTAIVMFGDHYYYVNPSALKPENENPRALIGNRSPLIVYNPRAKVDGGTMTQGENAKKITPDLCGKTIYRFTSNMDLYPTVCSLFGVKTDKQLTYGHSIFDDTEQSIGVGYLGGFTWGVTNENPEADLVDGKVDWHIWRTLNFVDYVGVTLTQEQLAAVTPIVNRTYASIYLDTALYDKNGFKNLAKLKDVNAYRLHTI